MTDEEFDKLKAAIRRSRGKRRPASWQELIARRVRCRDCDREAEHYMVTNELWRSAFPPSVRATGCLGLNYLERRLGRRLVPEEISACARDDGLFNGRMRLRRSERRRFSVS
jgi:hypothetical protein